MMFVSFIRAIQIIAEGENGREVALTLSSNTVMVIMEFRASVERDEPRRVEREVEPAVDFDSLDVA